jgi:hypothetical protein
VDVPIFSSVCWNLTPTPPLDPVADAVPTERDISMASVESTTISLRTFKVDLLVRIPVGDRRPVSDTSISRVAGRLA